MVRTRRTHAAPLSTASIFTRPTSQWLLTVYRHHLERSPDCHLTLQQLVCLPLIIARQTAPSVTSRYGWIYNVRTHCRRPCMTRRWQWLSLLCALEDCAIICRAYEILTQYLRDSLGCNDWCANKNLLTSYLFVYLIESTWHQQRSSTFTEHWTTVNSNYQLSLNHFHHVTSRLSTTVSMPSTLSACSIVTILVL